VFFRATDLNSALHLLAAMAGWADAAIPERITLPWDAWSIRNGYLSERFVLTWLGETWSMTATLLTAGALIVALLFPDTMEIVGYREGDAQSHWRRHVGVLAWRPTLVALAVIIILFVQVFIRLGRVNEFLYFRF
jgi:hypothetical protein